jgi:putative ABC transport system substrate-binding protein
VIQRRSVIAALPWGLAALPLTAGAQAGGRVYRLGILHSGTIAPASDPVAVDNFAMPLRALGYVEGRNLVVERRNAESKPERLPGLASELVKQKVDVILAITGVAIRAAKTATTTIPIVLLNNADPVAAGFVQSLARPGGNITGVLISPEGSLAGKRVELLREMVPRATRLALLAPGGIGPAWPQLQETRSAASSLGLELQVVEVHGTDYARAFAEIAKLRPQALVVGTTPAFLRDRNSIIDLAAAYRLPAIYEWPRQVKDGGLMSYGANDVETYAQVAAYIDRIFRGAKPSDMPIWQPSKLYLVINLKTAHALGLQVPPPLRLRADEVIE